MMHPKYAAAHVLLILSLVVCVFLLASSLLEDFAVEYDDEQLEKERHKQRIHEFWVSNTN